MIKKRIIPEHEETYIVCNYCGEEIIDYSFTRAGDKHFHNMKAGGVKGTINKTCRDSHLEEENKKAIEKELINGEDN